VGELGGVVADCHDGGGCYRIAVVEMVKEGG
jgi:hypothetical protein